MKPNNMKNNTQTKQVKTITNGCGGNKGTKCGVELYIMPHDGIIAIPNSKKK